MKIENILEQRGNTHGDFTDNADIAQRIKAVLWSGKNWHMRNDVEKEAMEVIASKLARWVSAPKTHLDNPIDIAGYSTLVVDRMTEPEPTVETPSPYSIKNMPSIGG